MKMNEEFNNILEASKALLVDASSIVKELCIDYVIVGGWCPYLRNERNDIVHPGTKDVDILFRDADVDFKLRDLVSSFLDRGYLVSGKHPFQLLKVLSVKGVNVVLNVDILHPSESNNPDLFVDHFEFDFCENEKLLERAKFKSIVLPSSKIIFDGFYNMYELKKNKGFDEDVNINLIDWSGMLLSKCESFKSNKRPRDSFDIMLMFIQRDIAGAVGNLKKLVDSNEDVAFLLDECAKYLTEPRKGGAFDNNVARYCDRDMLGKGFSPSKFVAASLRELLS